jgi:hypothetical protein
MITVLPLVPGQTCSTDGLNQRCYSVLVDNPTNQWWYVVQAGQYVPKYTTGMLIPLPGVQSVTFQPTTPASQISTIIAGEMGQASISTDPALATAGLVQPRAQFYDRRPVSVVKTYHATRTGPFGDTLVWAYTAPVNRLAFLDILHVSLTVFVAAGSPNTIYGQIYMTGTNPQANLLIASGIDSPAGLFIRSDLSACGVITSTDSLGASISILSSTSQVQFDITAKLFEFDA